MKILLLGEYSGLHRNLSEGLNELGHTSVIASFGDGWKQIPSDLVIGRTGNSIVSKVDRFITPYLMVNKLTKYDIIQLINPFIFNTAVSNYLLLNFLILRNKKSFLVSCGKSHINYKFSLTQRYSPYDEYSKIGKTYKSIYLWNRIAHDKIVKNIDGIIPITYSYAEGFRRLYRNTLDTIPLPINSKKITWVTNKLQSKIKIFHGINQYVEKGTSIIKEALELIKEKYPNDVIITVKGRMPLEEYINLLAESNIIIDQCRSYSYGMNALYSMALGKVVLSGCEAECMNELRLDSCPIVNITPSKEDIFNKLEYYILNRQKIIEHGIKSRIFVEKYHDHIQIAEKYLKAWNSI